MKMLRMSAYCHPEQMASAHLSHDLNEAYRDADFYTENYVPTPSRGISKEIRKKYKKIKYEEQYDGHLKIHRFSLFREGRNPIMRALRYLICNLIQYFKGSRAKDIDIVMASSTPPTQGILAARVKKKLCKKYKRNVPLIYNLQDIFPDSLVNAKMTKKGSLIWKIGRKIENYTYRNADKIVVISEGFKRNIMEKGVPEEKIAVIPNWVDTEEVRPVPRAENKLFDRYGLDRDKFYICYSGNVGHSQNMDMLLDCAKRLQGENDNIHIVIIGEGAAKNHVAERIEKENIRNVTLLPYQDYADISHVFSLGDMGLIISKKGIGTNSVPSKTWSIMSAARPVLASFDLGGDLDSVIGGSQSGVCIPPDDIEALCGAILQYAEQKDALAEMGKRGRIYMEENLTRAIGTGKWVSLIKEVVGEQA